MSRRPQPGWAHCWSWQTSTRNTIWQTLRGAATTPISVPTRVSQRRTIWPRCPPRPATVAAYAIDLSSRLHPASVRRHLAAIAYAHRRAALPDPLRDPWLKQVLSGLRRERPTRSKGKDAFVSEE